VTIEAKGTEVNGVKGTRGGEGGSRETIETMRDRKRKRGALWTVHCTMCGSGRSEITFQR
jgi:hypothetical protein